MADSLERDVASTCEKFEDLVTKGCNAGWLDRSFEAGYLSSQGRANGSLHTPESKVQHYLQRLHFSTIITQSLGFY